MGGDGGSTFKLQNNDSTCQLCSYITGTALILRSRREDDMLRSMRVVLYGRWAVNFQNDSRFLFFHVFNVWFCCRGKAMNILT